MTDNRRPKLMRTIFTQYRDNFGLLWRIMLPIAIIAMVLEVVVFFYSVTRFEKYIDATFRENVYTAVSNVNTIRGVHPTLSLPKKDASAETSDPDVSWGILPIPYFTSTERGGITWLWGLNFRSFDYSPLILLLLTLYPLSLAMARILRGSASEVSVPLTARDIWRSTGRKALSVFGAALLFVLIVDVGPYVHGLASWLIPSQVQALPIELPFILIMVYQTYVLVTLSLYNPCLILENNSIVGIFRRSHALVSGARLRFFGIYLLTGWIASVMTSVVFGAVLLAFSVFIPDLAQVRDALSPLRFLTLFIGGNVEVILPQLLSVPVVVAILVVKGLIATFLVPIWAILTTHLYFGRVDAITEAV
ncbi:hypothetical protein F4054_22870 [Candidatus Poribacteria bacterium]|nr:hypothetical protein [Candidatus Poribacteria bacterium]MYK25095.1 hypothetical protein [Candidatus Poribacteria bacterium]